MKHEAGVTFRAYLYRLLTNKRNIQERAGRMHREETEDYRGLEESSDDRIIEMISDGGVISGELAQLISATMKKGGSLKDFLAESGEEKHRGALLVWESVVGPRSAFNFPYQLQDGLDVDSEDESEGLCDFVRRKARAHRETYEKIALEYDRLIAETEAKLQGLEKNLAVYKDTFRQGMKTMTPNEKKTIGFLSGIDSDVTRSFEEAGRLIDRTGEQMKQVEKKALRKLLNKRDFPEVESVRDAML